MTMLVAKVKNVLSGDKIVLVPSKTNAIPPPERVLTLENVRAPTYAAKKWVRDTMIGKLVHFKVAGKAGNVEFGDIKTPLFDSLVEKLVSLGLARVKDNISDDNEAVYELKQVQAEAQQAGAGEWAPGFEDVGETVASSELVARVQNTPLKCVVEKVICGDRAVTRMVLSDSEHVVSPVLLAGIKCPRTDDPSHAQVGQLAKMFVEDKLMTTGAAITVTLIGESQLGLPVAVFTHPLGNNIAEKLCELGYAEVVDWQLTLVGSAEMGKLRKAELTAKALGKGMFAAQKAAAPAAAASSSNKVAIGSTVPVTVARVVSADTYVVQPASGSELTVQLASVRAPRPNDPTGGPAQAGVVATAKEYARELLIGKQATMHVDGLRAANPTHNLDARFVVRLEVDGADALETLVGAGWATVIRHAKATANERALNWDKLMEDEEAAKEAKKGVHSPQVEKLITVSTRVVDALENAAKARTFLNGFKQKKRLSGFYVDYVVLTTRVRLLNPKEGTKLLLILGGLTNDKLQLLNTEGTQWLNKHLLQRPVEFDVYDADKVGGFIGDLYAQHATEPVQVAVVEQGFAKTHPSGINANPYAAQLAAAEDKARELRLGVWHDYDPAAEKAQQDEANAKMAALSVEAATPKFFDVEVVDVDPSSGVVSFHMLGSGAEKFAAFKKLFNDFHAQTLSASSAGDKPHQLTKPPKKGEYVSAKFENDKFYRARVINFDRGSGKCEVKHIDFGNTDSVPLLSMRALPAQFSVAQYPPFAKTAVLADVDLPPSKPNDYFTEAIYALEDLVYDKKLVLAGVPLAQADYLATLYDAEKSISDLSYTINKQLVSEGMAVVKKGCKDKALVAAQDAAKSSHVGCWEFGDATAGDDDF